jgi:hypothetical protein
MSAFVHSPPLDPFAPDASPTPERNPGDEYETFGDDERLAREHAEYFSEDYHPDFGSLP